MERTWLTRAEKVTVETYAHTPTNVYRIHKGHQKILYRRLIWCTHERVWHAGVCAGVMGLSADRSQARKRTTHWDPRRQVHAVFCLRTQSSAHGSFTAAFKLPLDLREDMLPKNTLTFIRHFYPKRLTLHSSYSFTFYQLLLSLGIEPTILALLVPCSTIWATGNTHLSLVLNVKGFSHMALQ